MVELTVVEICAGAGGQSLGLHLAGFRHELAVEIDGKAAATLRNNLCRLADEGGHVAPAIAEGDVADSSVWRPEDYPGGSLLAGGVPCPPFSKAGKQLGSGDERDLFAWAIEAAGRMQPDAVMLENVKGLSEAKFSGYRQAVVDRLSQLGYAADWQLLNACDYGVPQLRPRFVLVALRDEFVPYFRWPEPKPTTDTVGTPALRPDVSERLAWGGAVGGEGEHDRADDRWRQQETRWCGSWPDPREEAVEAVGRQRCKPGRLRARP